MQINKLRYFISLHFLKLPSPNSPKPRAMVVHHGMLGSARNMRPLCTNSNLLNYVDILLLDARNHGLSPHVSSHSIEDLADDLNQFILQQCQYYEKFVICGHSMGGLAVMDFSKEYHTTSKFVQRIIIVDIGCNLKQIKKEQWDQQGELKMLIDANNIDLHQSTSQIFSQINKIALDSNYADLLKFNVQIIPNSYHKWKANLPIIIENYKKMMNYRLQHCHWEGAVDIIYGSESVYFEEDQLKYYMQQYPQIRPNENIHRIEGAGHWVHLDKKQQFIDTLQKILKRNQR